MTDDEARLLQAFSYIDEHAGPVVVARVEMVLGHNESMTISAGGNRLTSSPSSSPFSHYEVILDHEPARFWHRLGDSDQLIYSNVPRILVAHHVIRHGGLASCSMESTFITLSAEPRPRVTLPITTLEELTQALANITGVPVSSEVLIW